MKTAGKLFVICYRALTWAIIAVAAALLVLFIFGIRPYAVRTGSMEPAIPAGSLSFVNQRASFDDVQEGDVIAFRVGEMFVTHRAVAVGDGRITTKGDANNSVDAGKVTADTFIGKTVFWIPFIGRLPLRLHTGSGRFVLIGAFALFIAAGLIYDRVRSHREKQQSEPPHDAAPGGEEP